MLRKNLSYSASQWERYVALELFRHIPERIERLILINASARILCDRGKKERERSLSLIEKGKFDFLINRIFKNSIHDSEKKEQYIPLLKEMAYQVGPKNYTHQLTAMINKDEQSDILSNIKCPTLIIAGREDQVMPNERSEHLATNITHSELIYLENCGHMAMLELPEKFNNILSQWL